MDATNRLIFLPVKDADGPGVSSSAVGDGGVCCGVRKVRGHASRRHMLIRVPCPLCDNTSSAPERVLNGYALESCGACGFSFVNPQQQEAEVTRGSTDRETDELVRLYSEIASVPSVQAQYKARLRLLEGLSPERGRLLDFGCAAGHFVEQAQARGWEAHGTELGEWAADAARRRGVRNVHVGMLATLGLEAESFDVVHAAQVFEHLPTPRVQLKQLVELLKPSSISISMCPTTIPFRCC